MADDGISIELLHTLIVRLIAIARAKQLHDLAGILEMAAVEAEQIARST